MTAILCSLLFFNMNSYMYGAVVQEIKVVHVNTIFSGGARSTGSAVRSVTELLYCCTVQKQSSTAQQ